MRAAFRVWDKLKHEFIDGFLINSRGGIVRRELDLGPMMVDPEWHLVTRYGDDNLILQQWTGLRDCKRTDEYPEGQMIFEGDITNVGVVEFFTDLNWDSGGSVHPGFYFRQAFERDDDHELSYHDGFDDCEVIGDILSTPELNPN